MTTETHRVTAYIPKKLLLDAQKVTGKGITETLKEGLQKLAVAKAYKDVQKLRGKIQFSLDLDELRKDKDED